VWTCARFPSIAATSVWDDPSHGDFSLLTTVQPATDRWPIRAQTSQDGLAEPCGVTEPLRPATRAFKPRPGTSLQRPPGVLRTPWRFKSSHPHEEFLWVGQASRRAADTSHGPGLALSQSEGLSGAPHSGEVRAPAPRLSPHEPLGLLEL
jgi:hypothetical protein